MLHPENLHTLSPVFPRLMTVLRGLYGDLDVETQELVDSVLVKLIEDDSHIILVDLNLAYVIQVLRRRYSQRTETLFNRLFRQRTSSLVRREIVLAWAGWRATHTLSDLKKHFQALSKWERRAFIVGSFILGDEGKHWRQHSSDSFSAFEEVVRMWYADRTTRNPDVPV